MFYSLTVRKWTRIIFQRVSWKDRSNTVRRCFVENDRTTWLNLVSLLLSVIVSSLMLFLWAGVCTRSLSLFNGGSCFYWLFVFTILKFECVFENRMAAWSPYTVCLFTSFFPLIWYCSLPFTVQTDDSVRNYITAIF